MNRLHLRKAIEACVNGGVIAYPTESVYGLGCLPFYQHSVFRIMALKKRLIKKGLILVAANISQLELYVDFQKLPNIDQIKHTWPGPVTWLLPTKSATPSWLTGQHKTLAVRVSAHPIVRRLCEKLGPIVSTSANPKACIPAKSALKVRSYFHYSLAYIIPGNIVNTANPTEIRDALTGRIIRAG